MAWSFDHIEDTVNVNGRFVCRVVIINDATGERRCEFVWFGATSPLAAAKTAAVVKLLQLFADRDADDVKAALRQLAVNRIDQALANGATVAAIIAKINEIPGA